MRTRALPRALPLATGRAFCGGRGRVLRIARPLCVGPVQAVRISGTTLTQVVLKYRGTAAALPVPHAERIRRPPAS
jgi:hypothetical protein